MVRLGRERDRQGAARVHPPPDRAAARAPGVPAPAVPARHREGGLGPARRLVVPARRAADDQARLGAIARGRHVPQRRGDRGAGRAGPAGGRRLVPAALQRQPRGRRVQAPAEPASGAGGRSSCAPRTARSTTGRRARGRSSPCPSWRWSCSVARTDTGPPSARRTGSSSAVGSASRRRASWCRTCATWGSAISTCRPRSRRARGPRTATTWSIPGRFSEELGGEREFDALAAAVRRTGLG